MIKNSRNVPTLNETEIFRVREPSTCLVLSRKPGVFLEIIAQPRVHVCFTVAYAKAKYDASLCMRKREIFPWILCHYEE